MNETLSLPAKSLNPADIVMFYDTPFQVRSIVKTQDKVEITWWDTNNHQPYTYDPDEEMARLA